MLQTTGLQRVGHNLGTVTTTKCVLPPSLYSYNFALSNNISFRNDWAASSWGVFLCSSSVILLDIAFFLTTQSKILLKARKFSKLCESDKVTFKKKIVKHSWATYEGQETCSNYKAKSICSASIIFLWLCTLCLFCGWKHIFILILPLAIQFCWGLNTKYVQEEKILKQSW